MMKKIVPFNNVLDFNTDVKEITAISLEHEINKTEDKDYVNGSINDLRRLFTNSDIGSKNYGGYTFFRTFVEPMMNNSDSTIGTLINIDSYLYTQGKGNDEDGKKDDSYIKVDSSLKRSTIAKFTEGSTEFMGCSFKSITI